VIASSDATASSKGRSAGAPIDVVATGARRQHPEDAASVL
jgi:hypothetical protein